MRSAVAAPSTPAPNGPCAGLGCGMYIVRYGPGAATLCETCTARLVRNNPDKD